MEKRSRCFYRFGCANDGSKRVRFDSIRFDSIQNVAEESRISNLCDFEREKDSAVCRRRGKNARDRSVPRRGKVVSIPLRVIFVVLVECPFGISDLSLDLTNALLV